MSEASDPAVVKTPPRWRGWAGRLVLFGGLAAALLPMLESSPRDRILEIELRRPVEVERVDLSWATAQTPAESLGGVSLRYARGDAPRIVRHTASLAPGPYQLQVRVERRLASGGPRSATSHSRRVNLEGDRARIVLEERR